MVRFCTSCGEKIAEQSGHQQAKLDKSELLGFLREAGEDLGHDLFQLNHKLPDGSSQDVFVDVQEDPDRDTDWDRVRISVGIGFAEDYSAQEILDEIDACPFGVKLTEGQYWVESIMFIEHLTSLDAVTRMVEVLAVWQNRLEKLS